MLQDRHGEVPEERHAFGGDEGPQGPDAPGGRCQRRPQGLQCGGAADGYEAVAQGSPEAVAHVTQKGRLRKRRNVR